MFNQIGFGKEFLIQVFLVDDGCTDGTPKAIKLDYPQVTIIQGNGSLYWNRGMHFAWETAASVKDFDYYFWLNDDTFLFENGLKILLIEDFVKSIVCGITRAPTNENATYGGFVNKSKKLLTPNGSYQNADFCNGNCVLIPKYVYKKLGNLDPIFQHALGDFDYSLRARKQGIEIKVAPDFIGYCEIHDFTPKWRSKSLNVVNRLKNLYNPLSGCYPTEYFVFDKRHNGIFAACLHYFTIHLRCLFPFIWQGNNCR